MRWKLELGEQIRKARKAAQMTQEQLADRVGVWRQMISRYEAGRDAPAVDVLAKAAETLNTEFRVRGYRITFVETAARLRPRPVAKQLELFEKPLRSRRAVVDIRRRGDRILIRAEIPA